MYVAVGQLLPTEEAVALTFRRRDNEVEATDDELIQDYRAVAAAPTGRGAGFYKHYPQLDMPDDAVNALLDNRIDEFEAALRRGCNGYDAYPEEAKLGLMDMVFNLGYQ